MSSSKTYTGSNIDTSILHFQGPYKARINGDGEFISSDSSETGSIYYTHHRLPVGKNVVNVHSFNRFFMSFSIPKLEYATATSAKFKYTTAIFSESAYTYQGNQNGVRHLSEGRLMSASIGNTIDNDDFRTITASGGIASGYDNVDISAFMPFNRSDGNDAYSKEAVRGSTSASSQTYEIDLNNKAVNDINTYLLTGGRFQCAIIEDIYDYNFRQVFLDYKDNDKFYDNRTFGLNIFSSNAAESSNRPQIIIQYDLNIPESVIQLTEGFIQVSSGSLIVR
tara:strand:+ start:4295 stop:5134 length:840 start_codon:yes stop_codon:yes gene_type:complete